MTRRLLLSSRMSAVMMMTMMSPVSTVTAQSCSSCAQTVADAEVCTRLCQSEEPIKFFNPAFTGTADSIEPQYIGTSSPTDDPPNFNYGDVTASLLWQCLDRSRTVPIVSAEELGECCQMDDFCKETMMNATACQADLCLDPDLKAYTANYFDCVSTGGCVNPDSGNDHGAFCLQFTLGSAAAPDGSSGIRHVYDTLQSTQQCSSVDPFVEMTCSISDNCCPNCSKWMGAILDVVLNSVILNGNLTDDANFVDLDCPIDHSVCCPDGVCPTPPVESVARSGGGRALLRQLQATILETNSTTSSQQHDGRERIANITDRCTSSLSRNMIAYNGTFAGARFIECLQTNLANLIIEQEIDAETKPGAEGGGELSPSGTMSRTATLTSTVFSFVGVVFIVIFV